ncbi:MAG: hypothetical protein RL518_2691 [Pseudomonadota bacterium]|jgi:hypothetical protein
MTTALIILGLCALVLIPTLLFVLLVQPIWAFVEVCGTSLLGRGGKILWLLALLIFTIVGSIPYALFVSASAALRQVTIVCMLLIGVVAGVAYGVIHYNPHLRDQVAGRVQEARSTYTQVKDISEIAKHIKW